MTTYASRHAAIVQSANDEVEAIRNHMVKIDHLRADIGREIESVYDRVDALCRLFGLPVHTHDGLVQTPIKSAKWSEWDAEEPPVGHSVLDLLNGGVRVPVEVAA